MIEHWEGGLGWTWDENGFWWRVRISSKGTVALWKRWDHEETGKTIFYELIHWVSDGHMYGPVNSRKANGCRELMTALRREAVI